MPNTGSCSWRGRLRQSVGSPTVAAGEDWASLLAMGLAVVNQDLGSEFIGAYLHGVH